MKGSLVGESERKIRAAMEVFKAVSQGKGMFIATCNRISALPPELRRRFTMGTFFVDLPSKEERKSIWKIWLDRYSLQEQAGDDGVPAIDERCEGYTGAEIRALCDNAYRMGATLEEAFEYVVPVIKSNSAEVEALRKLAEGRFISASKSGTYQIPKAASGKRILEMV
jgi:SpoVK/Ycf46/Vps4 family AAA+-type ATPase